ncbi:MAG: phosphopeptide-binding protein, partial [Firmicutes bacterium]|nr:phosphopeptide-binding protein [Bacillota bacterium]
AAAAGPAAAAAAAHMAEVQADAAAKAAAPKAVPGPGEKACPYCRTVMPESAAFCIVCGQKQP